MSDCLHCDINQMVQERIDRGDADAATLTAMIVESLVDLILLAPDEDQSKVMADVLAHFGQVFLDASKDRSMGVCAGSVPFFQANVARVLVDMNLAFHQHQVIGLDFNAGAAQGFHEAGHIASSVDHPFGSLLLQFRDELLKFQRDGRVLKLGKERPVEIGRKKLDGQFTVHVKKVSQVWNLKSNIHGGAESQVVRSTKPTSSRLRLG